jgi:type IV protein arginine methyltransferase
MDDSVETRIPASCPANVSEILHHAWNHDLGALKPLLAVPGRASVQEPTTGETPLHAAIRACGPANGRGTQNGDSSKGPEADREEDNKEKKKAAAAAEVVRELFFGGAIWNDLDSNGETPGCVAARLGLDALYQLCVEAGVRAELLFGLLDGYEQLSSEEDDEEEEEEEMQGADSGEPGQPGGAGEAAGENAEQSAQEMQDVIVETDPDRAFVPPKPATDPHVRSEEYLRSNLTYSDGKLVDESQNGVMMAWETSIMRESVDALLPGLPTGRRILNIGFGMGIIDAMFAETQPARHHIIEAHSAVLSHIAEPGSRFGKDWEAAGPSEGAYKVHGGKWQDVIPKLLEQGELYDAIYFDTFGEDYSQLRMFFTEHVPGLLDENGVFGFFNGLGADRKVCYDVYQKVAEMHLSDAGMDVEWKELDVDMKGLDQEGKGEWQGVKRRYWTLDSESCLRFMLFLSFQLACTMG